MADDPPTRGGGPARASRLRIERIKAGWRLGALAQAVGLRESTIWRVETRRTKVPKLATRKALARVLGVSESKLFKRVGK